jgi:hypothetical protein
MDTLIQSVDMSVERREEEKGTKRVSNANAQEREV